MSHPQKNTLLQAARGNAETKACKRVFFSPTQENFFPSLLFLIKLFSQRTGLVLNLTDSASNVNLFVDSFVLTSDNDGFGRDRRASANSGFKKLAVQWLNEHLCFVSSSVVADSLVLRNRQLLKPAKRYMRF